MRVPLTAAPPPSFDDVSKPRRWPWRAGSILAPGEQEAAPALGSGIWGRKVPASHERLAPSAPNPGWPPAQPLLQPRRPAGGVGAGAKRPARAGGSVTRAGLARGPGAAGKGRQGPVGSPPPTGSCRAARGPLLGPGPERGVSGRPPSNATLSHPRWPCWPHGKSRTEELSFSFLSAPKCQGDPKATE